VSFGEPIEPGKVTIGERDEEIVYERVSGLIKARIQQMLDEMRSHG
jgi:hypothetical protein